MLEWVFRRCEDKVGAARDRDRPRPRTRATSTPTGLEISDADLAEVLTVDPEQVKAQLPQVKEHLAMFGDRLPDEVSAQLAALEQRLGCLSPG